MQLYPERCIVFGNSGAGKSTLAHKLCEQFDAAHLDLDTIAWLPGMPPERRSIAESQQMIDAFTEQHSRWVIEGCYSDLLALVATDATHAIFLDLTVRQCQHNAKIRPWESHKYASKTKQDANLPMLLDWIAAYETREDGFSRCAHQQLADAFVGHLIQLTEPLDLNSNSWPNRIFLNDHQI